MVTDRQTDRQTQTNAGETYRGDKNKPVDFVWRFIHDSLLISKARRYCTRTRGMSHRCLYSQPQRVITLWSILLSVEEWVGLGGSLHTRTICHRTFAHPTCSTNRARRRVISLLCQTSLGLLLWAKPPLTLHHVFPPVRMVDNLRARGHPYNLPECSTNVYKKSFVVRSLYRFI